MLTEFFPYLESRSYTVLVHLRRKVGPKKPPIAEQVQHPTSYLAVVVLWIPLCAAQCGSHTCEAESDHRDPLD